jgi:hypothetical protein
MVHDVIDSFNVWVLLYSTHKTAVAGSSGYDTWEILVLSGSGYVGMEHGMMWARKGEEKPVNKRCSGRPEELHRTGSCTKSSLHFGSIQSTIDV